MLKKSLFFIVVISLFIFFNNQTILSQDNHNEEEPEKTEIVQSDKHQDETSNHDETNNHEEHGGNMYPLFFVIIALIIGAGTRHFLRKSPIPYTALLLIFGIGLGVATRTGLFEGSLSALDESINWAGNIDPHLILYIFLPTLIFEAAFAMDVHTFKKSVTNTIILAVPGIIVALCLTAALVIGIDKAGIGLSGWGWSIALMFGAVISATDPVAVVALLKDLGASKKLGTLIEGESMLNDGTAIVIFMVVLLGITGAATGNSPIFEFFRVAIGGTLVGIIIGWVAISWVRRVFNDALVEICVIIAAAYLTFFIAENFLHMSGVLGLVALGLMMASVGRTRISPEVEHFLHEFWELFAFIANTLIFIIVGVVIAQRTVFTANDFLILGILYIAIHIIRAIVILIFYPLMRNTGYGLPVKDACVVWYGALRGAVGLALALVVVGVDDKYIPMEIKNQFLFLTAGIVTLTLLINATTIKYLVNYLGLTKIAPAKALMIMNANQYLRQSSENTLEKLKRDRYLSRANWNKVKKYLPKEIDIYNSENLQIETIAETRRRILEQEKSSYWHQFKDGLLSPLAVRKLADAINEILDEGGLVSLSKRKDLEEMWKTPKLLNTLQSWPIVGKIAQRLFFDKLTVSYDCARGFVEAQEEAIKLVESMYRAVNREEVDKSEEESLAIVEEEINENKIHGQTFLRNLRKSYPEIYTAIATRQAIRSMLNYERHTVERLEKKGRIESDEANKMINNIEVRMKKLIDTPPSIELPKAVELLHDVPWLRDIDSKTYAKVVDSFQNKIFSVGDKLIKEKGQSDGLFVIARGTVIISIGDKIIDIFGSGNIIGEISLLTGLPRIVTVTAESPVTALWMSSSNFLDIINESKELENRFWNMAGIRFSEIILGDIEPFNIWRQKQFKKWLKNGEVVSPKDVDTISFTDKIGVLLYGSAFKKENKKNPLKAPVILEKTEYNFSSNAKVFICKLEKEE
ncbi:MAG: cation:proton antiporter [Bacteroidales bacterium]|nr:cation:proton antiporter [Bacteroidales bacterium]